MPFVEIRPARAGDRIRLSPRKGNGRIASGGTVSLAKRAG